MRNNVLGGYAATMPVATRKYGANRMSGEYAPIAEALGGHGECVTEPAELRPALLRSLERVDGGQAALLEVVTHEEGRLPGLRPESRMPGERRGICIEFDHASCVRRHRSSMPMARRAPMSARFARRPDRGACRAAGRGCDGAGRGSMSRAAICCRAWSMRMCICANPA